MTWVGGRKSWSLMIAGLAVISLLPAAWAGQRLAREVLRTRAEVSTADFATLVKLPVADAAEQAGFFVWQGFDLRWGYNHRINRIGSMIEPVPAASGEHPVGCTLPATGDHVDCRADLTVSAASGTGHDTAEITSYHAMVRARGVHSGAVTHELHLAGLEGSETCRTASVTVAVPGLVPDEPAVAVLGGFDLLSLEDADQFRHFELAAGAVHSLSGRAEVEVEACITMECGTLECEIGADIVDYSLLVSVLVVAGPADAFGHQSASVTADYRWDEVLPLDPSAIAYEPAKWTRSEELAQPGADATVAISRFELAVIGRGTSKDLHMLDFSVSAAPMVDSSGTVVGATPALLFRNWKPGMSRVADRDDREASRRHSMFSFKEGGRARWSAELTLLEFADATIIHQYAREHITWEGLGRSPNPDADPEAASERVLPQYLRIHRVAP